MSTQFNCQKHFYFWQFSLVKLLCFKQFSFAFVYSLKIKTVLFKEIQFILSAQFSSTWPVDRTLSGTTTSGQSVPVRDGKKRYYAFPRGLALLERHHQIV